MPFSIDNTSKRIEEYLDIYVRIWPFSGSVLVARDGSELFRKSYGQASIELGVPNSSSTKFRIWSTTKQFTTTALMILKERGLIKLTDSIVEYFPDYPELDPCITIHHLMSNTSGMTSYNDFDAFAKGPISQALTHDDIIRMFKDEPLKFAPGEGWNYSNSGYYLLGVLIERVSGLSYRDFLRREILDPLGMRNTGMDDSTGILPGRANGYSARGGR